MDREIISKAGEIVKRNTAEGAAVGAEPYCVLALIDEHGGRRPPLSPRQRRRASPG
jgi:hypothetical protein